MVKIKIQRLTPTAQLPHRASTSAAAWDLYSDEEKIICAGKYEKIRTGIATSFPEDYVALIKDRSGLAAKHGITHMAGVIDADFRGEYLVVLHNTTSEDYHVKQGERIAQLLILPLPEVEFEEVESLDETERGAGKFGSTGY